MTPKSSLILLAAGFAAASLSAQIVVPSTTTTFTAGSAQIVNAGNWDNGEPTGGVVGLVNLNGAINSNPDNYSVVQGNVTVDYAFNRNWNNVTWYQQGGTFGSGIANINNGTGFNYYALGGTMSVGVLKLTGGSTLHIENGAVSIPGNTQVNDGTIVLGLGSGSFSTADLRNLTAGSSVINFLSGSSGSLTAPGIDFATLWSDGILKFNGANTGAFGDHFSVSGSTLSLGAVPEPSTIAMAFGLAALGFVLVRRRKSL
jgi:hypothetical protein